MISLTLLMIAVAYLFGSLSSAVVISQLFGLPDPRTAGSKNPGATNVYRLGGRIPALLVLVMDILKGTIPVYGSYFLGIEPIMLGVIAIFACLGHIFPLYFGFARLGLINDPVAVAFVYTAVYSPFAVMLLRTYFLAVPKELEEAALIDGATHWQVFWRVMLPIVSPGILTVALIIGLYSWNEFLIATTFLQSQDQLTAVVSFFLLSGQYSSDWGEIMAAALIIVLPVVILFVLLQRRFIEGMAGGSVKG